MRIAHPARSLISFTLNLFSPPKTGTVGPYDRHVFLCFKNPDAWLPHVEEDDLPKLVSTVLKTRKDDITVKTKVTICEGGEGTEFENGDVLIFPDMIKSKRLCSLLLLELIFFFEVFMHDLRGKARREEATWPGGGACCCCWSVVRMVVNGGAVGDPLQLLEKVEKQRWMLIASVAFGWGRREVTMC
ncbi:hypothetical protein POTOM_058388 [Populus tomentosa]|uniref:Uncharacterized protein n=1 Tax=Populus tomentosa TaxID=118781 RepID=A0A8X7XUJ7_POPTO|nr:hypothetical protein POTOM_058388 [Populus tomentosa]